MDENTDQETKLSVGALADRVNPSISSQNYDRYGFCGGKEYTDPNTPAPLPIKLIRARELKWREMCSHWEYWIKYRREKVRDRCRKGIPDSMRCEAWQRLCDSPMVLVARTKVIPIQSVSAKNKPMGRRGIFSTLSRNINHRSLPNVITTSPSFRIKAGRNESVRRTLLKKLSKDPSHCTCVPTTCQSDVYRPTTPATSSVCLRPSTPSMSVASTEKSPLLFPTSERIRWSQVEVPTERSAAAGVYDDPSHPVGNSFNSLTLHAHINECETISPIHEDDTTFTATVSVYGDPHTSILNTTDPIAVGPSSSGGYASLSTNSGMTDNTSMHNIPCRIHLTSGTSSNDSYPSSSINSSSINSSVASNLWPLANSAMNIDESCGVEDARDTLVPSNDPDPVMLYEDYCTQDGDRETCEQIHRDIDRQFPFHEIFAQKGGLGQQSLFTLLKAYTIRHPDKGYCQGQAPLAAVLLMFMPEPDAFWTFNEVCERYLEAYYDDGLERIQIDGEILYSFLKSIYPAIYKHLKKYDIQPVIIVLEWFMCVFTRTLPWPAVLRVLDMFFAEGKVILFRVALVLLYRMFGKRSQRRQQTELDLILADLRDVHSVVQDVDQFIHDVINVPVSPAHVAVQASRQSELWRRSKEKNPVIV